MPPGTTILPAASTVLAASSGSVPGAATAAIVSPRTPTSQKPGPSGLTTSPPRITMSSTGSYLVPGMAAAADVIVAGGGNAGLVAALEARAAGARVLLLERAERAWRGGNTKYTRNIRCAREGYREDELLSDLARVTGSELDRELAELTVRQ